jgi:isocitrate/isopropylmalate dehydrogenase
MDGPAVVVAFVVTCAGASGEGDYRLLMEGAQVPGYHWLRAIRVAQENNGGHEVSKRTHVIAAIGGDGVGPELVTEALRLLAAVSRLDGFDCEVRSFPHSGAHYRATGEMLGEAALKEIAATESLLFGAVGDPDLPLGTMERGLLFGLSRGLGFSVSVRPGTLYADWLTPLKNRAAGSIDMVIVRDASEDILAGQGAQMHAGTRDEVTVALQAYTAGSVERVLRHAYALARGRRRRLSVVTQANSIQAHSIWTRIARELSAEYPEVELEDVYPDAMAARMVMEPDSIDVVATTLWIGGTLSDLLGAVVGGIGLIGSCRINPERKFGLFEPAHGSAPKYTGRNVVSPLATFRSLAMLLEYINEAPSARRIEAAIARAIESGRIRSVSTRGPTRTTDATDAVIECL